MNVGDLFFGRRIRQNHALEHATVTILSGMIPNLRVSARSSARGFIIFGNVDVEKVKVAAQEALERLRAGEVELAIHPNCGTNVAVGFSLAATGWLLILTLMRSRLRFLLSLVGAVGAALAARPLGAVVQRHVTTLADLRSVRITNVARRFYLGFAIVEVQTIQE
jgi:hypothetical protein